jgi:hypothetical protein
MKAIIILSLILVMACGSVLAADGPFAAGSAKVGGGLLFMKQGGDAYRDITRLTISPKYTKFVSSGMYYGGTFSVEHVSWDSNSDTFWSIGPVFGIYLNSPQFETEVSGNTFPFIEFSTSLGKNDDLTIISFDGTVGMTIMATNSVGLDFSASFVFDNFSYGGNSVSGTTFLFGIGFSSFIF